VPGVQRHRCHSRRCRTSTTRQKSPAVREQTADTDYVTDSILIVEDSASVRRLIEVCLRELSLDIVGTADGISGLAAARETLPAAVVLDIGLPGMDGWEVLRRLRADDATRETKVLILTAHAQPEVAVQAQEGGADDFMTKPFRPTDLRDRVAKMIAS
jgi:CheY-like chemotaxis protein